MHADLHKSIIKCDKRALFAKILPFCSIHLCKISILHNLRQTCFGHRRKKCSNNIAKLCQIDQLMFKFAQNVREGISDITMSSLGFSRPDNNYTII